MARLHCRQTFMDCINCVFVFGSYCVSSCGECLLFLFFSITHWIFYVLFYCVFQVIPCFCVCGYMALFIQVINHLTSLFMCKALGSIEIPKSTMGAATIIITVATLTIYHPPTWSLQKSMEDRNS